MIYYVKPIVCDYAVVEKTDIEEKLVAICNSLSNANLVAEILNKDLNNEVWRTKGTWREYEGTITCEKCGKEVEEKTPYCPYCGEYKSVCNKAD